MKIISAFHKKTIVYLCLALLIFINPVSGARYDITVMSHVDQRYVNTNYGGEPLNYVDDSNYKKYMYIAFDKGYTDFDLYINQFSQSSGGTMYIYSCDPFVENEITYGNRPVLNALVASPYLNGNGWKIIHIDETVQYLAFVNAVGVWGRSYLSDDRPEVDLRPYIIYTPVNSSINYVPDDEETTFLPPYDFNYHISDDLYDSACELHYCDLLNIPDTNIWITQQYYFTFWHNLGVDDPDYRSYYSQDIDGYYPLGFYSYIPVYGGYLNQINQSGSLTGPYYGFYGVFFNVDYGVDLRVKYKTNINGVWSGFYSGINGYLLASDSIFLNSSRETPLDPLPTPIPTPDPTPQPTFTPAPTETPTPSPTPQPTEGLENYSINTSLMGQYYSMVDNAFSGLANATKGVGNFISIPVIGFTNVTDQLNNSLAATFNQSSGHKSILSSMLVPIFSVIPGKIMALVSYYLILLLVLLVVRE